MNEVVESVDCLVDSLELLDEQWVVCLVVLRVVVLVLLSAGYLVDDSAAWKVALLVVSWVGLLAALREEPKAINLVGC